MYDCINNEKIGIVAWGNILGYNETFATSTLDSLRQILPPEIELISAGSSGMTLLEFFENKTRLILLDNNHFQQLGLAEVLYWTHSIGTVPKEIVTINILEQVPSVTHKVLNYLKEWGVIQEQKDTLLN